MSLPLRQSARAWILILLCAAGFLVWSGYLRMQRVEYVTNTAGEAAIVDATSFTGYAGGKRWLMVPEHNNRSYQWIAETQQMLARGEWRVRHIDYENAPTGRAVHSASPYRWWLGLLAWCDHTLSGRPLGLSVERAALWADPLLQLLLLVGTTVFVARQFGGFAAAILAGGLVAIFPFAGSFLPGVPGDRSLTLCCAFGSVLPLLAASAARGGLPVGASLLATPHTQRREQTRSHKSNDIKLTRPNQSGPPAAEATRTDERVRRLFFMAGVAGGLGLWISAVQQTPLLIGIALGGILGAWIGRDPKQETADPASIAPWRAWALGGASTCLAAYLIEYFPAQVELRLQVNHPLYGLAWIGLGELLLLLESWLKTNGSFWNGRRMIWLVVAAGALAALPIALALSGTQAWFIGDQLASRLTSLPNGVVAKNFAAWLARDGLSGALVATSLPLLLLGPALWLLTRRQTGVGPRTTIALATGPIVVALGFAFLQLAWWSLCGGLLMALFVVVTATLHPSDNSPRPRWLWSGFAALVFLPGLFQLIPSTAADGKIEFTRLEVEGLLERSLAHWIADHAGPEGATVLLPPDRTPSWCFHGGLRGIGTGNWENRDGLAATIQLATATTGEEALARLTERGITHMVLPSWDSDLDAFVGWTLSNPDDSFLNALHRWALPTWLRPLPYQLPVVAGFEGQSVAIFQVTDESNKAAALSRLGEYFLEMQEPDEAVATGEKLKLYPADLGALVALAQVERARGDTPAFAKNVATIVSTLSGGFDRSLPWDRRVSLAIVLAQGQHDDLAREQVRRCLEKINEARIRSLTTGSLFRLQVLGKAYGLPISDARLRELAVKLVPPELRQRLTP